MKSSRAKVVHDRHVAFRVSLAKGKKIKINGVSLDDELTELQVFRDNHIVEEKL